MFLNVIKKGNQIRLKWILVLQCILFIIGAILGNFEKLNKYTAISISFLFVLTAIYLYSKRKTVYSKIISIGMFFCFLGDLVLAKFLPGGTMFGMGLFAIAHVFFISGYIKTIKEGNGNILNKGFCIAVTVYYIYFIALWNTFLRHTSNGELFGIASLVYGLLISTMASLAISLYINNKEYLKTAIGSLIFLISDSVIAVTQTTTVSHSGIIIWTTYVIALYGVIYSNTKKI